ncbi:oxidoreductase [Sphaerisporangium siamense]|uniref:NADH:ubiquinone oxidoreductase subunit F (NADH-binding)/ferredoxin n=1 Tax=Sphaerisporangium siamense TaxID=795645 RepID=A0A7W7G9T1_9ACTN|nr:NADH-quinone oxidoreductase subunit NuoF family protein [Sphaerisporangium siamense]MBB4703178.1 NADH:ubiquinone oxidoreductase subunit F (NADH-binding)/ferredoxin [Sphaerisporangium siamense]GII89198.1 oxidoreductase [Sphaerisporangium siamense]
MTGPGVPEVFRIGPGRLTAGLDRSLRLDYDTHRRVHGRLPRLPVDDLIALAELGDLRGRGGAGFPFARKLRAVIDAAGRRGAPITVVVNATEGEPAAAKDKVLLTRAPHLILDGADLVARALDAREIVVGVAHGGPGERSLLNAVHERGMTDTVRVVRMPDRFISGEGGALVAGINGERPIPPGRKVRASEMGVGGMPTMLSNAETYAQLALLAMLGVDLYSSVGTPLEPGTVLLSVGGSARRPAVVETPTGVRLREVLDLCDAVVGKGVLLGGYHGTWMSAESAERAEVSRAGFEALGGALGAGIVIPLGEGSCPLGETARVARYMAEQSAGQCGPCYMGLPDLARAFGALADGDGHIEAVKRAAEIIRGRGACGHPDGTARFVLSAVGVFAEDVMTHAAYGTCGLPVRGVLPLPQENRAKAQEAQLTVDWSRCEGHGLCAHVVPELISLDQHGYPVVSTASVPFRLEGDARRAIEMCPALALRLAPAPAEARR